MNVRYPTDISPVTEVIGEGDQTTAARSDDGQIVPVDAIFTIGGPRPRDGYLTHLGLDRSDGPLGSFLTVDETGETSNDRFWAAGSVAYPPPTSPWPSAPAPSPGAAVNLALVTAEFDAAVQQA